MKKNKAFKNVILEGDALIRLRELKDNSVDSVVTDPPYGLSKEPHIEEVLTKWIAGEPYDHKHGGFMGKKWDSFVPHPDIWKEVYRVLKPGGHALVFVGTRTQDLMTIALRLAGFEVRDVIEWLYFTGFPKSHNISKAFDKRVNVKGGESDENKVLAKRYNGWGTALKPAHEPIIMVRKPLEVDGRKATIIDNVKEHGTGGMNVDDCRVATSDCLNGGAYSKKSNRDGNLTFFKGLVSTGESFVQPEGRFPANCITLEDDQFYSKYFNVSPKQLSKKASKKDRNSDWQGNEINVDERNNIHPTVKPTDLMAWLVRLVTPPNGIVLDPFAGSGSTLVAAKREGFDYVGIEITDDYIPIIKARLNEDE